MTLPSLTGAGAGAGVGRRRAWLMAGCAALAVLVYLTGWTAYATNGLSALGRLDQRPPGATTSFKGADIRVLSLVRTGELLDQQDPVSSEESTFPAVGASWVVATIEVTRRVEVPNFYCAFELLGPDRRRWEPESPVFGRTTTSLCRVEQLPIGRAGRLEVVFGVPDVFLDRIYGVAVPDAGTRKATPVLRPG